MPSFIVFLMRLLALAATLVFAAGVALVTFVGAALWLLHAGWTRLGGAPLLARFLPGRARRGSWTARMRPAPAFVPQRVRVPVRDISDVEPK